MSAKSFQLDTAQALLVGIFFLIVPSVLTLLGIWLGLTLSETLAPHLEGTAPAAAPTAHSTGRPEAKVLSGAGARGASFAFSVLVGREFEQDNAKRHLEKLKLGGYPDAYVSQRLLPRINQKVYLIWLGRFSTFDEAEVLSNRAKDVGLITESLVLKRDSELAQGEVLQF